PIASKFKYALDSNTLHSIAQRYPLPVAAPVVPAPPRPIAAGPLAPALVPPAPPGVWTSAAAARAQPQSDTQSLFTGLDYRGTRTASWARAVSGRVAKSNDTMGGGRFNNLANKGSFAGWVGRFGWTIVTELNPVFCVPANDTLLGCWDRLEDRLYKIRHCQD